MALYDAIDFAFIISSHTDAYLLRTFIPTTKD